MDCATACGEMERSSASACMLYLINWSLKICDVKIVKICDSYPLAIDRAGQLEGLIGA